MNEVASGSNPNFQRPLAEMPNLSNGTLRTNVNLQAYCIQLDNSKIDVCTWYCSAVNMHLGRSQGDTDPSRNTVHTR